MGAIITRITRCICTVLTSPRYSAGSKVGGHGLSLHFVQVLVAYTLIVKPPFASAIAPALHKLRRVEHTLPYTESMASAASHAVKEVEPNADESFARTLVW